MKRFGFLMIILFIIVGFVKGQENVTNLTEREKKQSIEKISELLNKFYVFPEKGYQIAKHMNANKVYKLSDHDQQVFSELQEALKRCYGLLEHYLKLLPK